MCVSVCGRGTKPHATGKVMMRLVYKQFFNFHGTTTGRAALLASTVASRDRHSHWFYLTEPVHLCCLVNRGTQTVRKTEPKKVQKH